MFARLDVINPNSNLSILENRTEELFVGCKSLRRTSVLSDIFSQSHDVLWLTTRVPEQLEPAVPEKHVPISANEVLLVFILLAFPLDEFRIALSAGFPFLLWNNFVPLPQPAQLFSAVAQHLVKCAVGEMFPAVNLEDADPDLGALKDRAKELLTFSQFLLSLLPLRDIFC